VLGNEHVHVCACASTVASAAKALPAVMAFQALAGSMAELSCSSTSVHACSVRHLPSVRIHL
jgi:hypothetical protein